VRKQDDLSHTSRNRFWW